MKGRVLPDDLIEQTSSCMIRILKLSPRTVYSRSYYSVLIWFIQNALHSDERGDGFRLGITEFIKCPGCTPC